METFLSWPEELAAASPDALHWRHAGSNICLDFHGDPLLAKLAVFSDGNHHMALQETAQRFMQQHPDITDIFYATTPPGILVNGLQQGGIYLGNLKLSRLPDIFISPLSVMEKLRDTSSVNDFQPFMQSRGNVLLVRRDNPKNITGITDVLREDVRLFISNPKTEKASFDVYHNTMVGLLQEAGIDREHLDNKLDVTSSTVMFGESIHHREAPQALYAGHADVAMVYYHLALRYTRIFADYFDFIPLGGGKESPKPAPANITTTYYAGIVNNGGQWGQRFMEFLFSDEVTQIYASHGLCEPVSEVT